MSAVKALQQWCRIQCEGYRDVSITNMTTSFRDGLAFCALIHKHRPDLVNFDSLNKESVYENNKLAFKVAEEELGIPALLDAEDMVALRVPDRLSILTYVSQYYNYFHGRSPIGGMGGIKRPAEGSTGEPCGKMNPPVVAKVFTSNKPSRENSPPCSSNITRPPSAPKQAKYAIQEAVGEKSHQTGTLSNKCVSCNNHVHLVQRHLVDGKLYHRSCAKLLSPINTVTPLRDLPTNTPVSKFSPLPDVAKTNTTTTTPTPSRLWSTEKPSMPSSSSSTTSTSSPSWPTTGLSSTPKESPMAFVSKPSASRITSESVTITTTSVITRPSAAPHTPVTAAPRTSITVTPRTSATAAKTLQSKLKFFQSDTTTNNEEKKTTTVNMDVNKRPNAVGKVQEAPGGQTMTVNVSAAGRREASVTGDKERAKAAGGGDKVSWRQQENQSDKTKASPEDNSNPPWMNVALKKTDVKPESQVVTPKREPGAARVRVRLKADPTILADLKSPDSSSNAPTPAVRSGLGDRTPDKAGSHPGGASPNTSASEKKSPADWRSKLKPVTKETKPVGPSQSEKPYSNGAEKSQTSELSTGPSSSTVPSPIFVTAPGSKGVQNRQKDISASDKNISKMKPGYIPTEDLIKELQEIEDNLNEWERRGVELEMKLRSSEEEGEDDSLMDELMVEWFSLIRNKQVAIRRESELVYIGKTQDLEKEQPNVEQELRRLMEKPEHLKTAYDHKREEQLMAKLLEIVNDRNAIIEGLDEDRLREEEEDEELNKMMMNFNIKKDKPKKASPKTKLFGWLNRKEV
uniref:protein-methionine sulfoxide oxidase mical2b isoform X2 n=1 Tax=Monopterus albus TaxID=43700 RepID=UPI0009B42BE5|nr:MICAL-like protein 2 isoform X2 [Monopterus albus]